MQKYEEREPIILNNEGQKIFGVMHRPLGPSKYPVILMCHGLGGNKVGKGRLYVQLAEKLTKEGIAVLRIDFRGSGDSEGAASDVTIDGEVSDALMALDYLTAQKDIDINRIGLFGRSFGGAVAVLAAHQFQKIKSIALWAPVFGAHQWKEKWQGLHLNPSVNSEPPHNLFEVEGMPLGYPFLKQLFALNLQDKLQDLGNIPFLHIHGVKDTVVDLSHADHYQNVRKEASAESKFQRLLNTGHDFFDQQERLEAMQETVKWFVVTLGMKH